MSDIVTDTIRAEWLAKDQHYQEHPVPVPWAEDGTVLTLGQRVRLNCPYHGETPTITELTIRCYGNPEDEPVYDYSAGIGFDQRVEVGQKPMQQVWVFVSGRNCIHTPEDICEVLE